MLQPHLDCVIPPAGGFDASSEKKAAAEAQVAKDAKLPQVGILLAHKTGRVKAEVSDIALPIDNNQ